MLACFLLLSTTTAADPAITDARFEWDHEPITHLKPGTPAAAWYSFTVTDADDVAAVTIDLSAIDPAKNPEELQREMGPPPNGCAKGQGKLTCLIPGLVINTDQSTITVKFTITLDDGTETQIEQTASFTIDNTRPEVASITTDACDDETCYVKDGWNNITITFTDSVASFHKRYVQYRIGTKDGWVETCDGLTCWGRTRTSCEDGRALTLRVLPQTKDDAGNQVQPSPGSTAICDASPPEIDEDTIAYTTSSGVDTTNDAAQKPYLPSMDTATVSFNATEHGSAVDITINAEALGSEEPVTGSCSRFEETDTWTCTASFDVNLDGLFRNIKLPLTATDFAGNEETINLEFDVLPKNEGPPDDWQGIDTPPEQYANKHYLAYTAKHFYLDLNLEKKTSTAKLLDVQPRQETSCEPLTKDAHGNLVGTAGDLYLEVIDYGEHDVMVKLNMPAREHYQDIDHNLLEYRCTLAIMTYRGDVINLEPEVENVTIKVRLHASKTMGEKVQEEINTTLYEAEKNIARMQEAKKILNYARIACSTLSATKSAGGALSSAAAAMYPFPVTYNIALTLDNIGGNLQDFAEGGTTGFLRKNCAFLECNATAAKNVLGGTDIGKGLDKAAQAMGQENYLSTMNPYDSYVSAIMTGCVPAWVYHMEQWQGIDCGYALCLSAGIDSGTATLDTCQATYKYDKCTYLLGGAVNGLPFVSLFKNVAHNLADTLSNPVSFFTTVGFSGSCTISGMVLKNQELAKLEGEALQEAIKSLGLARIPYAICKARAGVMGAVEATNKIVQMIEQFKVLINPSASTDPCANAYGHIDMNNLYWNYDVDGDKDPINEQTFPFGNGQTMRCTTTGLCTATMRGDDNNEYRVTVHPTGDGGYSLFVDSQRFSAKDLYRQSYGTFQQQLRYTQGYQGLNYPQYPYMSYPYNLGSGLGLQQPYYGYPGGYYSNPLPYPVIARFRTNVGGESGSLSGDEGTEDEPGLGPVDFPTSGSSSVFLNPVSHNDIFERLVPGGIENNEFFKQEDGKLMLKDPSTTLTPQGQALLELYNSGKDVAYFFTDSKGNILFDEGEFGEFVNFNQEDIEAIIKKTEEFNEDLDEILREEGGDELLEAFINHQKMIYDTGTKVAEHDREISYNSQVQDSAKGYGASYEYIYGGGYKQDLDKLTAGLEKIWDMGEEGQLFVEGLLLNYDISKDDIGNSLEEAIKRGKGMNFPKTTSEKFLNKLRDSDINIKVLEDDFDEEQDKYHRASSNIENVNDFFKETYGIDVPEGENIDDYKSISVKYDEGGNIVACSYVKGSQRHCTGGDHCDDLEGFEEVYDKEDGNIVELLRENAKAKEKAAKQAKREVKKLLRQTESNFYIIREITRDWTGVMNILQSTARISRNMNMFTKWIDDKQGWVDTDLWLKDKEWFQNYKSWWQERHNDIDFENRICESRLGKASDPGTLMLGRNAKGFLFPAAHVEGIRISHSFNNDNFTYNINVFVANTIEEENLTFSVHLTDGSRREPIKLIDYDGLLVDRVDVPKGDPYQKTKSVLLEHESTKKYDEVCIRFHNDNLDRWFEVQRQNNEYCRELDRG